jgi:hypothetical protein
VKFDLKKVCENCPFSTLKTRITFSCRERAEEIAEMAYREGFVCHLHAEPPNDEDEDSGYEFRYDGSSQHCFGALAMFIREGGNTVPWERAIEEDPGLEERWWSRAKGKALADVFEDEEEFLEANP